MIGGVFKSMPGIGRHLHKIQISGANIVPETPRFITSDLAYLLQNLGVRIQ
jgi:hypothetical protein